MIYRSKYMAWPYRHVPMNGAWSLNGQYHLLQPTLLQGLSNEWRYFSKKIPLYALFTIYFWKTFSEDRKIKFKTCGCGRTYWNYRLKPAIFGDYKYHGGGC